MRWQVEAQRLCRVVLNPRLASQGFSGGFPFWHRLGAGCVECVTVAAYVRGGVQVTLGSAPLRTRLGDRSPATDAAACVRTTSLKGFVPIDTRAGLTALPAALEALSERLDDEGQRFWRAHDAELARRALLDELSAAVEQGDARRLRRALSLVPRKEAQAALDVLPLRQWHQLDRLVRLRPLASELVRWRPPAMLGAAVVVEALRHERTPEALLAWARRGLGRVRGLGPQLAVFTDHLLAAHDVETAARVFALIVGRCPLDAPHLGNALWCVLEGNGARVDRARARAVLKAAVRAAPGDAAVRFNAACLEAEHGHAAKATAHLLAALDAGIARELVRGEPRLSALLTDERVGRALRRRGGVTTRQAFVSHATPSLR